MNQVFSMIAAAAGGLFVFWVVSVVLDQVTGSALAGVAVGLLAGLSIGLLIFSRHRLLARRPDDNELELYANADEGLCGGNVDNGAWALALVKAGGDEARRKSEYVKLRVRQLKQTNKWSPGLA